jgi:hypothetical protein
MRAYVGVVLYTVPIGTGGMGRDTIHVLSLSDFSVDRNDGGP